MYKWFDVYNLIKKNIRLGRLDITWKEYRSLLICIKAIQVYDYERSIIKYLIMILDYPFTFKDIKNI